MITRTILTAAITILSAMPAAAATGSPLDGIILLAVFAGLVAAYFAPAIIAERRHKRNKHAIFALNLLGGWTGVGWVLALVWSLTSEG